MLQPVARPLFGRWLRIEKLKTRIALRQALRFSGQTKQVTVSKQAGKYFASILVETEDYSLPDQENRQAHVGVDLGIKQNVKNRRLARAITDAGFGTLRRFIEYKAALRYGAALWSSLTVSSPAASFAQTVGHCTKI